MRRAACVASAARAVLEMVQLDWEPLSHGELEQRLDQAVEEILEADLVARARAEGGPAQPQPPPPSSPQPGPAAPQETAAVQHIVELLKNSNCRYNRSRLAGRARLSLSHTVLLSLALLSRRLSYRSVSASFRLEKGNIHRIFFSFCERVTALREQQIRWPSGHEMADHLLPFCGWLEERGVPRVLGVVGHTRIPIRLPVGKQDAAGDGPDLAETAKDVHPDSWLNLELACDAAGRLIHCHVSRGSERSRGGALRRRIQQRPDMVPPGCCLLAGLGYPLTPQILTPFPAGRGPRENLYNRAVEAHLRRMDQAVEDLKARFQRLRYLDMANYERARAVVLTACVLHNVFLDMGDVVKAPARQDVRGQEDEGEREEAGLKTRDMVAQQLYGALESEDVGFLH
ncbi:uncharacterized protein LOC114794280 [Denticeps clupeoides]|uniref:DDE Tnp4 domain-containing protein n=1 Tax=Denticeps clupeoides TaxID=299321 RepID=A0AAY4CBQ4_9TELE|nr:uncharacterized protein LOC114794280 [Denticeps clupeoides]